MRPIRQPVDRDDQRKTISFKQKPENSEHTRVKTLQPKGGNVLGVDPTTIKAPIN